MNTAPINCLMLDGGPTYAAAETPRTTVFASTSVRMGLDPERSTGEQK